MFTYNIQIINNLFKIKINPFKENYEYAIYIYLTTQEKKIKIDQIWYQPYNLFTYYYDLKKDEKLSFSFFIRNKETYEITTIISEEFSQHLQLVNIENINFNKSFEIELLNDWIIPLKYQKQNNTKKHYILFNGALKDKKIYPLYNRVTWKNKFNANTLNIYDSTINLQHEMTLGWYRGTLTNPLETSIYQIIDKLKKDNNLKNEDLVFYGSSGGGWSSLKFSENYPGSTAVAINPQINILDYGIRRSVDLSIKNSFNNLNESEIRKQYKNKISITPNFFTPTDSSQLNSKFILVQNIQDLHHYQEHFLPFWKIFSDKIETGYDKFNHNYAIIYDHISGHAGEPPEIFKLIMDILDKKY